MELNIEPAVLLRLRERAVTDQYDAAMQEYLDSDDAYRRWLLVGLLIGHPPTTTDWQHYEALRIELMHGTGRNLTADDIAQLTELSVAVIRQMSERGEMPAPRYRWAQRWNEQDITEWLVQRSLP